MDIFFAQVSTFFSDLIKGPPLEELEEPEKKVAGPRDSRKRNSLAFNIANFVIYEEDAFAPLVEEVRKELAKVKKPAARAVDENLIKIIDCVAQGSMKQLRNEVIMEWKCINRKYKGKFGSTTLLHIICQEGYDTMLAFLLDPLSHSEYDENAIIIDPRNDRRRTPLMLCFTPPTATYMGQKYGLSDDGNPLSERPDGVEVVADWIKPGGPKNRENCVKLLLANGANVNDADFHGFTPLHYSAMWGWTTTVQMILDAGADVNCSNVSGRSPLMYAVEYLNIPMVQLLLMHEKITVNQVDSEGVSALMVALELGESCMEVAEILLKAGADPNCITHRKKTCFEVACHLSYLPLVHLLMNFKCAADAEFLVFLDDETGKDIAERIKQEEKKAQLEHDKKQREQREQGIDGIVDVTSRNRNPWGQWVQYTEKRPSRGSHGGVFYYNKVSRQCQRDMPRDFKLDKKAVVKTATYGLSFYH